LDGPPPTSVLRLKRERTHDGDQQPTTVELTRLADSVTVARGRVRPEAADLSRLYVDEGLTIAAVAARYGVAAQTVHSWLVAAGCAAPASLATVRHDISEDDIVRLYVEGGRSAAEIAGQLGCSTSLVYARLGRGSAPPGSGGEAAGTTGGLGARASLP
jgi:transposase-like protein